MLGGLEGISRISSGSRDETLDLISCLTCFKLRSGEVFVELLNDTLEVGNNVAKGGKLRCDWVGLCKRWVVVGVDQRRR